MRPSEIYFILNFRAPYFVSLRIKENWPLINRIILQKKCQVVDVFVKNLVFKAIAKATVTY